MTPEERVNQQFWEILQDIKEENLASGKGPIEYRIGNVIGAGIIPPDRKKGILRKLKELGVLRVKETFANRFDLVLIQPQFDEIYEKYRRACDLNSYLNDYQQSLIDGSTNDTSPQFSLVKTSDDTEIDKWLESKDRSTLGKIWQVASVLNSEWQLRDKNTFKIPIQKFVIDWVDNESELEAILTSLHNRKIIEVSRKLGETPPTDDPKKPQGSIWATINDQPEIIRREDTEINIFEKKFIYLRDCLKIVISVKRNKPVSTKKVLKKQIAEQALRPTNFTPRSTPPAKVSAEEVIKNFSPQNYPFVLTVISGILSLIDFSSDGKIGYQFQSPPGQLLINERRLIARLSQMGLLSHHGEDGVFGIVTLGNINVDVLREVTSKLTGGGHQIQTQYTGANEPLSKKVETEVPVECMGLTYSTRSNVLKYEGSREAEVTPECREMKFFLALFRKRGQTVDYKEIAKDADLPSYKEAVGKDEVAHEELKNTDFSGDASLLRRDFRTMVMKLGMSDKVFSKMITTIQKKGYKLNCK